MDTVFLGVIYDGNLRPIVMEGGSSIGEMGQIQALQQALELYSCTREIYQRGLEKGRNFEG